MEGLGERQLSNSPEARQATGVWRVTLCRRTPLRVPWPRCGGRELVGKAIPGSFTIPGWESYRPGIWVMYNLTVVTPVSALYALWMTRLSRNYATDLELIPAETRSQNPVVTNQSK